MYIAGRKLLSKRSIRRKLYGLAAIAITGVLGFSFLRPGVSSATVPGINEAVSVDSSGNPANDHSNRSAISGDGRYVAFSSDASNLASGDTNGMTDIFVRDRSSGTTTRVSVSSSGGESNGYSDFPSISYDGRYVVFESSASNLVSGDSNGVDDVFMHDMQTGTTTVESTDGTGTIGNNYSEHPDVSADGRFVTFASYASNLTSGLNAFVATTQVFVKDTATGSIKLVTANPSTGNAANDRSNYPRISCDGNIVSFHSYATDLSSASSSGHADIFVASISWSGVKITKVTSGNSDSTNDSLSCNGNDLSFTSLATNIVSGDTNTVRDVFKYDRLSGTTTRVSVADNGSEADSYQNIGSQFSSISDDGRFVVFESGSSNLDPGHTTISAGGDSIYIRDTKLGTTQTVSLAVNGKRSGGSQMPAVSADGSFVSYQNAVDDLSYDNTRALVPNDFNGKADIYVSETGF